MLSNKSITFAATSLVTANGLNVQSRLGTETQAQEIDWLNPTIDEVTWEVDPWTPWTWELELPTWELDNEPCDIPQEHKYCDNAWDWT